MRKMLALLVLFTLNFSFARSAMSAECACKIMPMYAVDATNWYHYGTINKTGTMPGCTALYPTGIIGVPKYGQSCSNHSGTCGPCGQLGSSAIVADFELYYGDANQDPAKYESLDDDVKLKAFLKSNIPASADPALYDDHTLSMPFSGPGNPFKKPIVVALTRNSGSTSEKFYAIVWRIKHTAGSAHSFVGIEISGKPPTGVSILTPWSVCNAVSTTSNGSGGASHTPVPGLLQVQLSSLKDDIAFIRLHNSDKNRKAGYKPCKP